MQLLGLRYCQCYLFIKTLCLGDWILFPSPGVEPDRANTHIWTPAQWKIEYKNKNMEKDNV